MARNQVSLQGVIPIVPSARLTDQTVQTKFEAPTPKHVRDLSMFSKSLETLIKVADEEVKQRALAQGQADAVAGREFSEGMQRPGKEGEANRKNFLQKVRDGLILQSEDPWYRVGIMIGEGKRVGLNVRDAALSTETLAKMSVVYDEKGNFIVDPKSLDEHFNEIIAPMLDVPAMSSIYAQRAAADLIDEARSVFHKSVTNIRDKKIQEYQSTQVRDQIVEQMVGLHYVTMDKSAEGRRLAAAVRGGLEDERVSVLIGGNFLDPKGEFHGAVQAYISKMAGMGSEEAMHAVENARLFSVGTTTVGEDNSPEGVAMRVKLDQLHEHYSNGVERENAKELTEQKLAAEKKLLDWRKQIDIKFAEDGANRIAPAGTYDYLLGLAKADRSGMSGDFETALKQRYSDINDPRPDDASATEEVSVELRRKSPNEVKQMIDSWGPDGSKRISGIQADSLYALVEATVERNKAIPEITTAGKVLSGMADTMTSGLASDAGTLVRAQVMQIVGAHQDFVDDAARKAKTPEELITLNATSAANARTAIMALKNGLDEKGKALFELKQSSNARGISVRDEISKARGLGEISDRRAEEMLEEDRAATDVSIYFTGREAVSAMNAIPDVILQSLSYKSKRTLEDLRDGMIRKFYADTRTTYDDVDKFNLAFTDYVRKDVADALALKAGVFRKEELKSALKLTTLNEDAIAAENAAHGKQMTADLLGTDTHKAASAFEYALSSGNSKVPMRVRQYIRESTGRGGIATPIVDRDRMIQHTREDLGELWANGKVVTVSGRWLDTAETLDVPDDAGKRAYAQLMIATGAPTLEEFMNGKMVIPAVKVDVTAPWHTPEGKIGFTRQYQDKDIEIPLDTTTVDPWTTNFFGDLNTFNTLSAVSSEIVDSYGRQFGVSDADLPAWREAQRAILTYRNK